MILSLYTHVPITTGIAYCCFMYYLLTLSNFKKNQARKISFQEDKTKKKKKKRAAIDEISNNNNNNNPAKKKKKFKLLLKKNIKTTHSSYIYIFVINKWKTISQRQNLYHNFYLLHCCFTVH